MPSNPTPETCRELADELERLRVGAENMLDFAETALQNAVHIITALRGYADAAGEIERLRAENARLSAAGERWIPVSERLPEIANAGTEESVDVLVYQRHPLKPGIQYVCRYDHNYGLWRSGQSYLITHWQLLPEPPANESEVTNDDAA